MGITFRSDIHPTTAQVIELYDLSGLPRPTDDPDRMASMYEHSNLVLTAWDGDVLVGACRCITDWVWSCYLADLAVHPDYQKEGIGRTLKEMTQEKLGDQCMILLLSVPTALDYYPKIGFVKEDRAFTILRKR